MLSGRDRADLLHVDLAGDHVVPEPDHHLCEQLEPVAPLVRDQDPQMLEIVSQTRHGERIVRALDYERRGSAGLIVANAILTDLDHKTPRIVGISEPPQAFRGAGR